MDDNVMEISTFSLSLSLSPKISLNWQEQWMWRNRHVLARYRVRMR
jgi:hypothetical protein